MNNIQNVESGTLQALTQTATLIISNDDAWPTLQSCYYLGYIPPFQHSLPKSINEIERINRRLCHSLVNHWQCIESIQLTLRIMGIFKEKWQEGQLEGAGSVVVVVDLLKSLVDVGGYQIVNIVQIARQIKTNKRPISWV